MRTKQHCLLLHIYHVFGIYLLRQILKLRDVRVLNGFVWLRIQPSGEILSKQLYEGGTESHEQHSLHANWEQQTKENAVVDGTSCCVVLECLVTSIACIT